MRVPHRPVCLPKRYPLGSISEVLRACRLLSTVPDTLHGPRDILPWHSLSISPRLCVFRRPQPTEVWETVPNSAINRQQDEAHSTLLSEWPLAQAEAGSTTLGSPDALHRGLVTPHPTANVWIILSIPLPERQSLTLI